MHSARRTLVTAVLLMYVAQVLGGRSMHLSQCAACDNSRCNWNHEAPLCCSSQDGCRCSFPQSEREKQSDEEAPRPEDNPHDSSTCRICQTLGQAQVKPVLFEKIVSLRVSPEPVFQLSNCYVHLARTAYHSRGRPPSKRRPYLSQQVAVSRYRSLVTVDLRAEVVASCCATSS